MAEDEALRYGGWPQVTSFDLGVLRLRRADSTIERQAGSLERYRVDGTADRSRRHVSNLISHAVTLAHPPTDEEIRAALSARDEAGAPRPDGGEGKT